MALERLEGMLRATHDRPRLVLAAHPVKERFDAFWIVEGRVVDWGPLPGAEELRERTAAAVAPAPPAPGPVPPDEVDEVRIGPPGWPSTSLRSWRSTPHRRRRSYSASWTAGGKARLAAAA